MDRVTSLVKAMLPKSRRAARAASTGDSPASSRYLVSMARWARISSSRSSSLARRRRGQRIGSRLLRGPHDAGDGADELFPVRLFFGKLAFAGGSEAVIFGAAVGFGLAPLGGEPAFFFEAVQGRVEGTVLDLQGVLGAGAEGLADAMAMLGSPLE